MEKQELRRLYYKLIYLISCALSATVPERELLPDGELEVIYKLAKSHSVTTLATAALKSAGLATEKAIEQSNMAIRKIMLLDAERAAILTELESAGIKYMPLKGVVMKELYPAIGLRQMADNDILFDGEYRQTVRDIMVSRGYDITAYGKSNHDVYMKSPVYNYEMHVSLFNSYLSSNFDNYFTDAFDRAVKLPGTSFGYAMTDEYYYLYVKAHEYKHFSGGGTGIRSLADTYVYLKSKGNAINGKYIQAELEKLGILDYAQKTADLAMKLFDPDLARQNVISPTLTEEEIEFLDNFIFYGTYGTYSKRIDNTFSRIEKEEGKRVSKLNYLFRVIFPPIECYKEVYPFFYKHRIFIPFLVVKRVCAMIFVRPKASLRKLRAVFTYSRNNKK